MHTRNQDNDLREGALRRFLVGAESCTLSAGFSIFVRSSAGVVGFRVVCPCGCDAGEGVRVSIVDASVKVEGLCDSCGRRAEGGWVVSPLVQTLLEGLGEGEALLFDIR